MDTYEKRYREANDKVAARFGINVAKEIFSDLYESEDEKIRKKLITFFQRFPYTNLYDKGLNAKDVLAWLEKQGEQKPTDKVEPKFKVGQWIVWKDKCYKVNYNGCGYELVDQNGLSTSLEYGTIDENAHLWDITKYAKDGDVVSDGTTIFIFKDLLLNGLMISYCDYDTDSGESDAFCPLSVNLMCSKITPATKEQRDLLFQKMKEAGYEWDAEKKELKKIEDEEYNGEDYGIDSLYHAQRILEKTFGKVDGYQTDDGILSHKCAITAVKKLYEQKSTEWGEEDERRMKSCVSILMTSDGYDTLNSKWLKSLKQRIEEHGIMQKDKKLTDVNHEYFSELLENNNSDNIDDYSYQVAYCMSHDWANETPTWDDVQKACKLGAEWKEKHRNNSSTDWSEEDEEMLKMVIKSCEQCGNEYAYYWLNSLKDRVQPQPKREWNEEDKRILDALISSLINERFAGRLEFLKGIKVSSVIDWLKSLKEKIKENK